MASQTKQLALSILFFGCLSFILAIIAELKKPALGTPIPGKEFVTCKFPMDPSVALGALSTLSVLISSALGFLAIYFPYKGKSVPKNSLLDGITMKVFFVTAILFTLT
ncbi:hypothetical protein KSP40_PGU014377 [Platanthera guangdongensis]|uniref:Uncharacterized protein n=1 Tax=Platanthera guangdongensis TaxID=2320717 RepID=A0ABR2LU10_9ASPA